MIISNISTFNSHLYGEVFWKSYISSTSIKSGVGKAVIDISYIDRIKRV